MLSVSLRWDIGRSSGKVCSRLDLTWGLGAKLVSSTPPKVTRKRWITCIRTTVPTGAHVVKTGCFRQGNPVGTGTECGLLGLAQPPEADSEGSCEN